MVRIAGIAPRERRRGFLGISSLLWVLAVAFFAYTALEMYAAKTTYRRFEVEAALLVDACQRAGALLRVDFGLTLACAAVASSIVPLALGVRNRFVRCLYVVAALTLALVALGAWFFHYNSMALINEGLGVEFGRSSPR